LAVSNLNTGEVEYLHSGNVARAVQVSSSIPVPFKPVEIDGQLYVNGGLLDNVPVAPLVDLREQIVAVGIMPLEKQEGIKRLTEIAVRTFQMSVSMQDEEKKDSDLIIRVEGLSKFHILNLGHNEDIYVTGYNHVKELNIYLPGLTTQNRKQGVE